MKINIRVVIFDIMIVNCGLRFMRMGKMKVVLNMVIMCWVFSLMVWFYLSFLLGVIILFGFSIL